LFYSVSAGNKLSEPHYEVTEIMFKPNLFQVAKNGDDIKGIIWIFVECILLYEQPNQLTVYRLTLISRYNIQFDLLELHILTTLSGHHQVTQTFIKCSVELQDAFTSHMSPYLQLLQFGNCI
jgi:hypothetical protein